MSSQCLKGLKIIQKINRKNKNKELFEGYGQKVLIFSTVVYPTKTKGM